MRIVATSRTDQNRAPLDPWTAVHFSAGLAMGLLDIHRIPAITSAIAYEVAEQFVEREKWGREFFETKGPETIVNAVVDTAAFAFGHWLGKRWLRT